MKQPKSTPKKNNPKVETLTLEKNSVEYWIKKLKWILLGVTFLIYVNSLNNGYNMDDELVTRNHKLTSQGLSGLSEIFSSPYYSDDMGYSYGYRPIVHLSFALEHDLFGEKPSVGHFINMLLYALSGVYLFRFLNLLFGTKNYLYSFLASMLFIVHPIHTEVVDSLKNRDEILAVLFSILFGIQFLKYVIFKANRHLIWTVLLFVLAILSKKSIYPFLIILPAAIALTHEIPFKRLFITVFILAFPAAIFGSEMQLQRGLILAITPLITLSFVYFILSKKNRVNFELLKPYLWVAPAILTLIIVYYLFISGNLLFTLLLIPVYFWSIKLNFSKGIWLISGSFLCLALIFNEQWFFLFSTIIPLTYAFYQWFFHKEKQIGLFLLSIIAFVAGAFVLQEIWIPILVLNYLLFIWLLFKKTKWAIVYSVITLLAIVVVGAWINISEIYELIRYAYGVSIMLSSVLYVKYKVANPTKLKLIIPLSVSLLILFASIDDLKFKVNTPDTVVSVNSATEKQEKKDFELMPDIYRTTQNDGKNIFKEGRMLEYVENPLVVAHTKSQFVATGFYAVGKYVQLFVFPQNLSFYYGYATISTQELTSIPVLISILIHLIFVFLIVYYANKNTWISIGFGWYLASILLFSNWIELVAGVVGERLAYLPSIGFFIGVIGLVKEFKLLEKYKKQTLIGLSCVGILLAGRTMVRNTDWKNNYTLMTHDIKHLANSAQANNLVARSLMGASMDSEMDFSQEERLNMQHDAINYFDKALQIYPYFFNAAYDKGRVAKVLNDTTRVIEAFEQAAKIGNKNFLYPYYELQDVYLAQKDLKNYLAINKKLIILDSLNPKIYSHLANSYYFLKEFDSSEIILQKAVKKFPNNNELNLNLQEVSRAKQAWENEKAASK